jgi:glyoxylase-like metal-dependent hydrolase (beta-lactamase superfamily II)
MRLLAGLIVAGSFALGASVAHAGGADATATATPTATATAGQPAQAAPAVVTQLVAPGLWMLVGQGGNVGVSAGEDGTFIVDDQFAPSAPAILAAVQAIRPGTPRFVLNTHWHGDHTGGNESFGTQGAVIVAHDNVRRRMSVEQFNTTFNRRTPPSPAVALPVVTFASEVTLHLNGDDVRLVHVANAHTDGDAIVHFRRANVIHAGDLYFNGNYPFVDVASGGSIRGMIAAADAMLALADENTKIIPGHGPLATARELREYRDMLAAVTERVAAMLREGRPLAEVVAARPTAPYDDKWGRGWFKPDVWVGFVYADLAREFRQP